MKDKRKRDRLWIEDFRITNTEANRGVRQAMNDWKEKRERPKHFTNAIRLYLALVTGDTDKFYELLMEFLPKVAYQMMRSGPSYPNGSNGSNGYRPQPKPVSAVPVLVENAVNDADAVDDFLDGLGLENNF